MRRYGGHYKISGPPVNVPGTLDQVINILPHMPNQLQLYPVKLKQKLEYKTHYMYDVIRKDCVIAALTWLKQHNDHYRNVEINEDCCSLVWDDGLSQILIQEGDADENCIKGHDIEEQSTSQSIDNENSSQNEVIQQFCKFPTNDVDTHPESLCHIGETIMMKILQN